MQRSLALSSLSARVEIQFECGEKRTAFPAKIRCCERERRATPTTTPSKEENQDQHSEEVKANTTRNGRQKHILNLCIGFNAIVVILGAFFSLFVYDIEDLEEASAVSFRDGRRKGTLDDARDERKKKRRNHEEEKEKETEEAHSTRRRGSQVGSAVTPNARFDDVRSSFAQSFAALSKGGNGGSFPYRYVFDLLLFARLCRVFQ